MLSNMKVRTGILLVLGVLLLALLASNGTAWLAMYSSNDKLDRVNSAYSNQVVPVYEASTLLQRSRLNLAAAAVELQAGRFPEADRFLQRAREAGNTAAQVMADFMKMEKSATLQEKSATLNTAYQRYASQAQSQGDALGKQDTRAFIERNDDTQAAAIAFDETLAGYLKYIDERTDELVVEAHTDYAMSRIVSIALAAIALVLAALCWIFMQRSVLRPLRLAGQHFDKIAAGDLTARVEVHSTNEMGHLFSALRRMQENLARTVSQVRRGVDEINVGSREISAGNTDLSSRTEQQAASLEETAASMEELASTVKQNADNARQANQLAASASDVAERGGAAVSEVVSTMEGISASSRKISEIVSVIDGIAFQTNILALNAAVEAARAGEQGKGFAVVAGEVRSLAQRSAQAAKEIKVLIEDSVSKVGTGSQQVERAGATMQEIVASVKRVTDIMGEISAASEEQSGGIDQVNRAVSQMDEVTQQNAALVEEAAAAAGSLQEQAQRLAEAVAVFKINAGEVIEVPARQLDGARAAREALRQPGHEHDPAAPGALALQ